MKSKEFMDYSKIHKFIDFLELLEDNYSFVIKNTNLISPIKPPRGIFKRPKIDHHYNNFKYQKPPKDNNDNYSDNNQSSTDSDMPELITSDYRDCNENKYSGETNCCNQETLSENMNIWTILDETKKYEGCTITKYGKGYDMKCDVNKSFYSKKYLTYSYSFPT